MTPLIKSGQEHVLSPINLSDVEVGDIVFCKVRGYIGETSKHFMHLETEQIPNPKYAEIQSSLDALTKSVGDIEAGITVTFSDGVSY